MSLEYRAFPVVLSAPSGAGKTSIARTLVSGSERFIFSVSITTRPPRQGEQDGVDYHFVAEETFQRMVEGDELAEWAEVHGHRYGTPRRALEEAEEEQLHAVLDIDVQGARQIRMNVPGALLIFILPPSGGALGERLRKRGTEGTEESRRRLALAREELEEVGTFDHVVVNEVLDSAVREVRGIVDGSRLRTERITNLASEIRRLQDEIDGMLERSEAL